MLRYNIFNMIHKALRAMLYDTAQTLQQTDFADTAEAAEAFEKMIRVIHAFKQHGHHEDSILMPVIQKFQQETIASFEKEHVDDRRMGYDIRHLQNIFNAARSKQERLIAGSAFTKAFGNYLAFNLQHLQREETELNRLLWNHYTDQEIQMINERIIAGISPDEMRKAAQWVMRAINPEEAINWLKEIKANAQAPVFDSLFRVTETELPEHFRAKVQDAVLAEELSGPVFLLLQYFKGLNKTN